MSEHKSIGHLLLEQGTITEEQLNKALKEQELYGSKLGDVLINLGYATEEQVISILSEQMGLAYIDLESYQVEQEVLDFVDDKTANRLKVIPIFKIENTLTVVMIDPLDLQAVDDLNNSTGLEIQPVFGTKTAILDALNKYYIKTNDLQDAVSEYQEKQTDDPSKSDLPKEENKTVDISVSNIQDDSPAIKFVNLILTKAINDGASDIHFEPNEKSFEIRCRIDGVLSSLTPPPQDLQGSIISRLKILANLDIAEKRLPQDGRIKITIDNKNVDLRVSSFPTIHGENIVIRILDKSQGILSLDKLGLEPDMIEKINELITIPNGIILVTGPTGSGKTTTLYSFLNEINRVDKNIMTLEDPVEYQISGIRQANVDEKSGFTFNVGLRSILRQDPDVIMIGEIRDLETAEIAIQSALTGHLVFSTLHTNDAPSTITRLIDMGIEPFLISTALSGILAQRLIRKLCDACKREYTPQEVVLKKLNLQDTNYTFYEEVGCDKCRNTGFKGRIGIYELYIPTPIIRHMINEKKSAVELEKAYLDEGFINLKLDGINKVILGITSLSEVLRIT